MRTEYFALSIFICSMFVSCSKGQTTKVRDGLGIEFKTELKQNVWNAVEEYINSVNSERIPENSYKVFRLHVEQDDYEVSFLIYPIIYCSHLVKDPPSSYLTLKDNLVLINTGIEKISIHDEVLLEKVKDLSASRLENDLAADGKTVNPDFRHRTHNPAVWKVTVGDSLMIDKEAKQPVRIKFVDK